MRLAPYIVSDHVYPAGRVLQFNAAFDNRRIMLADQCTPCDSDRIISELGYPVIVDVLLQEHEG